VDGFVADAHGGHDGLDALPALGAPDDPQAGNTNGKKDVLRSADFNNGSMQGFSADSGLWTIDGGALFTAATTPSGDAVTIYHVGEQLPSYYELQATINAVKPTGGWKANSYVIFDYFSPTDFKFAGIDVATNKLVMGQRTTAGWMVEANTNADIIPDFAFEVNDVNHVITWAADNFIL